MACQKGMPVSFITVAFLVHELMEARNEKRLLRLQQHLAKVKLLIVDERGFVPLSETGAELLNAHHKQSAVRTMDGNLRL